MSIKGPFRIGIVDQSDGIGREIHFDFTPVFRALDLGDRAAQMRRYVTDLRAHTAAANADVPERQGMLVVLQLAEALLPHLEGDEIPLAETIAVELAPDLSVASLPHTSH